MNFEHRDPTDVAYARLETVLQFANVGTRWCKTCGRKIYILRRDDDGAFEDFTANGREHAAFRCGEDVEEGRELSEKARRVETFANDFLPSLRRSGVL